MEKNTKIREIVSIWVKKSDLKEAASNLYKTFRKIKKQGLKKIYVVKIPNIGAGIAINDRLKRASN